MQGQIKQLQITLGAMNSYYSPLKSPLKKVGHRGCLNVLVYSFYATHVLKTYPCQTSSRG